MSNTKGKYQTSPPSKPEDKAPILEAASAEIDIEGSAMLLLADGIELPEAGTYLITINEDGEIVSVAPPPPVGKGTDIIVQCEEKGRKCIAEFRIKRHGEPNPRYVCKECVGPSRENEYQQML